MNYLSTSKTVVSLLLVGGLAACGGGGGGGSAIGAADPTLIGVAASGAPIANGSLTVTCGDASTKTGTTDANGVYSISLAGCAAPYVVSVTGTIGDAQATLVSVQTTAPAAGASLTVNITPLTNAIAATLASSGDPMDLITNFTAEKAGITDAAVKARKDALVAALADMLAAAGLNPASFDLISSSFSADRTGMDKVLDNVKVQVTTSGVNITNAGGVKVDDMGDKTGTTVAADLSAGSISFSKSTNFATPLTKLPATVDDNSVGDSIRDLLNACFAQPKATRGSLAATLSAACQAVPIASDYLNDGRTGAQEFDRTMGASLLVGGEQDFPPDLRGVRRLLEGLQCREHGDEAAFHVGRSRAVHRLRVQPTAGLKRVVGFVDRVVVTAEQHPTRSVGPQAQAQRAHAGGIVAGRVRRDFFDHRSWKCAHPVVAQRRAQHRGRACRGSVPPPHRRTADHRWPGCR